ncbi:MAG: FprA family A-type flavoprotein [Candidatus Aminicenantes bacterium]|nr:FprA family A-type flavoprotein [Candidatus Aminicenantes bacterium]
MKNAIALTDDIYWIGVNDFETDLFESIWPLPEGVSYNAYLIRDQKNVILDTVKKGYMPQLLEKIQSVVPATESIDYLVINHMEPDHSGSINALRRLYPDMQIVCNSRTVEFLRGYYGIDSGMRVIGDGEQLELGTHTLEFHLTPMVHWPETMMTFETRTGTLFSMDAFGGFGALRGGIFDDEVDLDERENETLRYYANIVAKYSPMVQRALKKLSALDIRAIAPTHGTVFRTDPGYIIDRYDRWSRQQTEPGVVIAYASMYGHTQTMAEAVARSLAVQGIKQIRLHNLSRSHLSYVLRDVWRYQGLILASSAYNTKPSPFMESLLSILDNDKLKNRLIGIIGTYSWSGGGVSAMREFAEKSDNELLEPVVESKFAPDHEDLEACHRLGGALASRLL